MSDISDLWNDSSSWAINSSMKNEYFSAEPKQSSFLGLKSTPYSKLRSTGGAVDVWKDMYWSNSGNKEEVPCIHAIEHELKYGTTATQFANLLSELGKGLGSIGSSLGIGKNVSVDSFVNLYAAKTTGFTYNFPWLINNGYNLRTVTNEWGKTEGIGDMFKSMAGTGGSGGKSGIGDLLGTAAGVAIGAITPGFGFEDTKAYGGTNEQEITITFPLYNTLNVQYAYKHFTFVNLFTFQNLKTRTSLMSFIPPKIYTIDSSALGGVYMAAAVVSNFKVDSIGTTRAMSDWGGYGSTSILMPEAYRVSITFRDLLSQSSNIFAGTMGGTKIKITNGLSVQDAGSQFASTNPNTQPQANVVQPRTQP
jgi:hypothetical protein